MTRRTYTERPAWVDCVVPGSVLLTPSGDMRVVRKVSRCAHWRSPIFSFAIRRCSWTRRPYTIYTWGELVRMGWTSLDVVVRLDSAADKQIERNVRDLNCHTLYCWDVVGVAP